MKILFHSWGEVTKNDMVDTLRELGHEVYLFEYQVKNYLTDAEFISRIEAIIDSQNITCIVGADYLPVLSKVSFRKKLPYIAWVYDSPCLAMYSEMIYNPYNFIFHFDRSEVKKMRAAGVKNIFHMPLAVNAKRVRQITDCEKFVFERDVTFLGTLYTDENNFLDQIEGLNTYEKAYLQALMDVQLKFFGTDMIEEIMPENFLQEILEKVEFQLEKELFLSKEQIMFHMIRKKMTVIERTAILKLLAEHFQTHLYTQSDTTALPQIIPHGYVDYETQMPKIFSQSRVNVNITLRSILSGISLRCLDIMCAGGFLISNYQPELAEYFEDGKEVVLYHSREELLDKIQYYLKHEEERIEIARNGQRKVCEQFDYVRSWEKIFNIVTENSEKTD